MAIKNFNSTLKNYPVTHLPTIALLVGTISFWLELYFIRLPFGHTSWLAWGVLIFCSLILLFNYRRNWDLKHWEILIAGEAKLVKIILAMAGFLGLAYLAVGLYASLLPPHLIQESDALMYHIMLPRQHLLLHSFAHISWSVPDLFLLPLDYALSPFELSTLWPNKLIQYVFFIASLGCVFKLVYLLSGQSFRRACLGVLAVMACHVISIQVGLAMLDLVMLYCFLAAIHSFLERRWILASVEFAFFFWSKSFICLQMAVIGIILAVIVWLAFKKDFSINELQIPDLRARRTMMITFIVISSGIALPHLIKSFYYTGTPLYPFGVGLASPLVTYTSDHWHAILQRAGECLAEKDNYGHGRSFVAFIKHFWLISVPEQGVNNTFDYPVGLIYLLMLFPFVLQVGKSLLAKKLPVLSMMVVIWWITWWFGSQQSRFLIVPICLLVILSISSFPRISRVLVLLIVMALGVEVISLANAHRHDWRKPFVEVLREKDKKLLGLKPLVGANVIDLDFPDAAFSPFPVSVSHSDLAFVIPTQGK
jgi:hypothetical protein